MKALPVVLLLAPMLACAAPAASAPHGRPMDQARFAEIKAKRLQELSQHIQVLQTGQSCVQAAQSAPALRSCMETLRQQMQALRPGGQ